MATPKSQRIGIWIIAIVLMLGTLGSFLVMGLSLNNQRNDTAQGSSDSAASLAEYQAQQKIAAQASADNSEPLSGYETRAFDPANVTKLKVEVLSEGSGEVIKTTDSLKVSYFGWTSDGKIFDSSKKKDTKDAPSTFALSNVITGWKEGLTGVKAGSVVRLTIPSDKAYGTTGSGIIPADTPLEFIVVIDSIEAAA
ncbi:MAG: hypothetical protein PWQ10_543 [Patescibacteria group bacterium]|nr:hypothetical protein [Patescibacteria group bacterium]